jgi:hypothetical protein
MGSSGVTILTWVVLLYFYLQNGHVQVVRPDQAPAFESRAECEANAPQIKSYIHLWQGEKSFAVKCQLKR